MVTSGTVASGDESLYPPGILIGQVTLDERRKRLHLRQRAPARQPAQPRHRAGAHRRARIASGEPRQLASRAAAGAERPADRHIERRTARLDRDAADERPRAPAVALLGTRVARCSALAVVFFQIGAVSEVPVFGVNVDLSPLLVAFVGLLCGSTIGAVDRLRRRPARRPRAAADARRDLADLHADRLLVRAPARAARPAGRAHAAARRRRGASAVSLVGYSLIEFMLGVDAPSASSCCARSCSGWSSTRSWRCRCGRSCGAALEGALPEDPRRRRRRRAYTTGGLSPLSAVMSAIERVRPSDPRVPVSPQLALRVAILGGIAMVMFGVIFFRLWYLQVLTGEQYVHQADVNHVRDLPIPAPRGEILDRGGRSIVTSRPPTPCRSSPAARRGARAAGRRLPGDLARAQARTAMATRARLERSYAWPALGRAASETRRRARPGDRGRRASVPPLPAATAGVRRVRPPRARDRPQPARSTNAWSSA